MTWPIPQDQDREIWYANRTLVLLHPEEPFATWARQFREPGEGEEELVAAIGRPFSFLVPLSEEPEVAWGWVQDNYLLLLDTALWAWSPDRSRWPEGRSLDLFNQWFDVEVLEAPWDLVSEPLHSNPPPREPTDWD